MTLQLPLEEVYHMACARMSQGLMDSAESLFIALLREIPDEPRFLGMLGALRIQQGLNQEAAALCQQAHLSDPASPLHGTNLASALFGLNRAQEAVDLLRAVCTEHPRHVMAHYNLGNFLRDIDPEQSVAAYLKALEIEPQHLNAMNNMGTVLIGLGRYDEAGELFKKVMAIDTENASAAGNQALLAATQGDHLSAIELYHRVPPSGDARLAAGVRFNQSMSMIRIGRYEEAFPLYEWRWHGSATLTNGYRFTPERQWRGEPLKGQRLLVWGEQGFGDTLQFVRYLTLAAAREPVRLTLAVHPALLRLFQNSLPMVEVIDRQTMPQNLNDVWDYHCPVMSLALALAHPQPVRKSEVPRQTPYLLADPTEVQQWQERLDQLEPQRPLRVGLSWRVGQDEIAGRSFQLGQTGPLMNLPGVRFYRLTRPEPNRPTEPTPPGLNLIDLSADLHDFAATAAFMQCLDLVVSVDTSVLHLAGALGRPALGVFQPHGGNFFDLGEGAQTWYPSMTVWRQHTPGDWSGLFERVAMHLSEMAASRSATAPKKRKPSKRAQKV
jgi:tetratricopeptide (TPR) repeat protein